ncbi:MAG: LLM class flavin-dependent oxidoreductase, partial [Actinobacteria bacterium]|nr:LLM class flavin-dependent oxidoreductase [Actinomycetota bacterium]
MEFGIFLNGYIPGPAAHITELEHKELFREAEYAIFADKHNWKYAWFGEHHAL